MSDKAQGKSITIPLSSIVNRRFSDKDYKDFSFNNLRPGSPVIVAGVDYLIKENDGVNLTLEPDKTVFLRQHPWIEDISIMMQVLACRHIVIHEYVNRPNLADCDECNRVIKLRQEYAIKKSKAVSAA